MKSRDTIITPLHSAVLKGDVAAARYFLKNLSKVDAVYNEYIGTSLFIAVENDDIKMVDVLLENRADVNATRYGGSTPLILAVKNGYIEIANKLIEKGAFVDAMRKDGNTALHIASEKGDIGSVEILLASGAKVDIVHDYDGTPLHIAAEKGHTKIADVLIKKGANTNIKSRGGMTPFLVAAKRGHVEIFKLLLVEILAKSKNVNNVVSDKRETALHFAAQGGHIEIMNLLIENNVDIEAVNNLQTTAIALAADAAQFEAVKILLDKGANTHVVGLRGTSLLHIAAARGGIEIVNILLTRGDDVEAITPEGITAIHFAARHGKHEVMNLLLKWGANLDVTNELSWTTYIEAIRDDYHEVVKIFLAKGMDIANVTVSKETALHIAAKNNSIQVAEVLLKAGINLEATNEAGKTALHIVVMSGKVKALEALLEKGAKINAVTNTGATPLWFAVSQAVKCSGEKFSHYKCIIENLMTHGADRALHPSNHKTVLEIAKQNPELLFILKTEVERSLNKIIIANKEFIQYVFSSLSIEKDFAIVIESDNQEKQIINVYQYLYDLLSELVSFYELDIKLKPYPEEYLNQIKTLLIFPQEKSQTIARLLSEVDKTKLCGIILELAKLNRILYSKFLGGKSAHIDAAILAVSLLPEGCIVADEFDYNEDGSQEESKEKEKESEEKEDEEEILYDLGDLKQLTARQIELILEHKWRQLIDVVQLDYQDEIPSKVKMQIISLLEQYAFIPPFLKNEHHTKILAMILGECSLADSKRIVIADQLLNQGISLPSPNYCRRNQFETTYEYFNALLLDPYDLYITLRSNPNIVTEQDEEGNTLLHSCKSCFKVLESWDSNRFYNSFTSCYALLRVAPNIDFSIKNIEGNTVVHVAALGMQLVNADSLFKSFSVNTLSRAIELGFNFFDKNNKGRSVLDIVRNNQHEQLAAIEAHVGEVKIKKLAPIFSSTQSICIDESQIDSELIELIIDVCKSGIDKYLARDGSHLAWYSFYLNNEHSKKRAKLFLKLFDANAQEPFIQLCALHVLIHNPHGRDTFTLKSDVFGEFKIFGNEQFTLEKFIQIIGRVIATMQKDNVMSNEKVLEIWKQIIQFVEKQDPDSFVLPDFSL